MDREHLKTGIVEMPLGGAELSSREPSKEEAND
jgi:hypothetical protein